uniref:mitogen-activated protein kinase kinase kinase n=1 Tax=Panagrolaimus superbus TaxID=310955 RepID=A0A914YHL7_9BILA
MSRTDTMRVPHIPLTSRNAFRIASSPTSSAENYHFKTPSSDSSTSREETPKLTAAMEKVRMRPSPIPAVTCYNFDAENTDEISFKRGSKVFVKSKNTGDKDYYLIEVDGKEGLAPVSFLQADGGEAPPTVKKDEISGTTKLGGGTFSDVFEVTWKKEKYAFKKYKEQLDFSKALQEAKLINSLDHKNIVKVYGICEKPVALLLELCEGKHLADLWKDDNDTFNPPLRIILIWARQIAEGLWYMHNRDLPICHADIKPQNCMLKEIPCTKHYSTEDSDKCSQCGNQRLSRLSIKLTDFGLSKVLLWELMTKQVPYHELEFVNGTKLSPMAIMFAIGKREVHLDISDSWPPALQNLLQACWEEKEENRPTMGEIITMIEKIPTSNPDYVMVGAPKKTTNLSNIEKIKNILNSNLLKFDNYFASDKPKAPPRKQINKHDIGEPTGFTRLFSIGLQNGEVEFHDHEGDRRRHVSTNDNRNYGTLPRDPIKNKLGSAAISTPELNQVGLTSGLERKPAMRKKPGTRGPDHSSMASCKPVYLGSTTPSSEASISFDTVEIVEDPAQICAPRPSRDSTKSYISLPRRSPSAHSQSTFYVHHDLNSPCSGIENSGPYDCSTLASRGSTDSANSKKPKNFFRKYLSFGRKSETCLSNVCYDSGQYFDLKDKPNKNIDSIDEDVVESLKLSPHLQTMSLSLRVKQQTNETSTTNHFVKQLNTPKKQRQQAVIDHRRNVSNTSEKLSWNNTFTNNNNTSVTPTSSNPPKSPMSNSHHHQQHPSSSDAGSISSTSHLSATNYSPSRTSTISFGTVVPLPTVSPIISQTTFPANSDEQPFAGFNNDHRSRAFTNATQILSKELPEIPPPIHPRSKSTDQNSEILDNLVQAFGMNNGQIIVENNAYFKFNANNSKSPGSTISPSSTAPTLSEAAPHYMALRSVIQKQRSDEHEAPPVPPRSSIPCNSNTSRLNTVVEIPKSQAPTLSPRLHHSQSASPNPSSFSASSSSSTNTSDYLTLENPRIVTNPHYVHTKSSPGRLDDEIPRSIAPQRPDTLELDEQPRQRIERNPGYVQLSGQVNDNYDENRRMPKLLPKNIPHHNRRH